MPTPDRRVPPPPEFILGGDVLSRQRCLSCRVTARQDPRWNHNVHYQQLLIDAIPASASSALDIGCGDGFLVRRLADHLPHVVGIDLDEPSLARAHTEVADLPAGRVELVHGDVLRHPFEPGSFDVVVAVATLHHLDARTGLLRMRELVAPGGTLGLVGLAAASTPSDALLSLAGTVADRPYQAITRRRYWEQTSPTVWPPPESYRSMRELVADLLPGARFRRHVFWRYSVLWSRPQN
jgi:SAM-dependent methyltransferase